MSFSLDLKDLPFKKLLFYMIPVPFGGGSGSEALILREHTYTILFARPIESTVVFTDKKKYTGRVGFFNTAVKLKEINGFKPIPSTPDLWNSKDGLQLTHNLHRYRLLPQVLQFLVHARQKAEGQELPRSALTRFLDQKVISESKSLFKKSPIEKLTPLNKFKLPMGFPIRFNDDQGISVLLTKFDNKKTLVQVGDFSQDPQLALDVLIQICSTLLEYSSN